MRDTVSRSPVTAGSQRRHEEMPGSMALEHRMPVADVHQSGGSACPAGTVTPRVLVFRGQSRPAYADAADELLEPLVAP